MVPLSHIPMSSRLLLVLVLAASATASSQTAPSTSSTAPDRPNLWAEGAAHAGVTGPVWIGGRLAVGAEFERVSVRVGLSRVNSMLYLGNGVDGTTVSVAGGVHQEVGPVRLAAHAGPALVWGTRPVQGPSRQEYTLLGAVGGVSAMLNVGPAVRLGTQVEVNASAAQTVIGGGPALQVCLRK